MVISNSSNDEINSLKYKRRGFPLLLLYKICPQEIYSYGLFLHTDDDSFYMVVLK